MKYRLFLAGILIFSCLGLWVAFNNKTSPSPAEPIIIIGNCSFKYEIAKTDEQRRQGLSGRQFLPQDAGMLFVFEKPQNLNFWMKEMNFDLDFIWFSGEKIVDLDENVPAPKNNNDDIAQVAPKGKADKVLEINAGQIKACGIELNSEVKNLPIFR